MRPGMTSRMRSRFPLYRTIRHIVTSIALGLVCCVVWTGVLIAFLHPNSWTSKTGPLPLDQFEPTYLEQVAPELVQILKLYPTEGSGIYRIYSLNIGISHTMYSYRRTTASRPRTPGTRVRTVWDPTRSDIPDGVELSRYEYGWPFRTLSYDEIRTGLNTTDPLVMAYHQKAYALAGPNRGLDRPAWLPSFVSLRRVPLAVNWQALMLNVVVWSAICYVILSIRPLLRAMRIRRRKSRGLCIDCRYPLDELTQCPECGTPRG